MLNNMTATYHHKLLNLVIRDKCVKIERTQNRLYTLQEHILNELPYSVAHEFLVRQKSYLDLRQQQHKQTHIKKFEQLYNTLINTLELHIDEKSFVSLVDRDFPLDIKWLLSLGPKFSLPHDDTDFPLFDVIADSEELIKPIGDLRTKDIARARIANVISSHKYIKRKQHRNVINLTLKRIYNKTKHFLKLNDDVMIVSSDKGKVVVMMYKTDYRSKIQLLLNDTNIYSILQHDPTNQLQRRNNILIKQLFDKKLINFREKLSLMTYNSTTPKLYALPKIHKTNVPMRPVVASINTPSSLMSKMLSRILQYLLVDDCFIVKNSFQFRELISNVEVDESEKMVSFDVVSLFTNIPVQLAIDIVNERWHMLCTHTDIPKELFIEMLHFCVIDANYFVFDGVYYKQKFGMPMGNPLSSIVADIVTSRLLSDTMLKLSYTPKVFLKYVDDIFAIVPTTVIDTTINELNSFHPKLQFTMEEEVNGKIPYLDVLVIRHNNNLLTDWYRKSICSNRILNFYTHHPIRQKVNTAMNLAHRVFQLSSPIFHRYNRRLIYNILSLNNYPHKIIQGVLSSVLTKINTASINNNEIVEVPTCKYKSMTYVNEISERIGKVAKLFVPDITLAYRNGKTLRNVFTTLKDPIPILNKTDVIYKIPCLGIDGLEPCELNYVGQTKQYLGKRLQNHRLDLRKAIEPSTHKTALMEHCLTMGHRPDFGSASVLACQSNYSKRLTIEALHIYTNNTYNVKRDTDGLAPIYCSLIDEFSVSGNNMKRQRTQTPTQHTGYLSDHNTNTITHNITHPNKRIRIN